MGEVADGDAPRYFLEFRQDERRARIALVRCTGGRPDDVMESDAWSHGLGDAESARLLFERMSARPERWSDWGRMAALLGSDFLDGVLDGEIVGWGDIDPGVDRTVSDRDEGARRAIGPVHVRLALENGRFRIVASRNGRPFIVLALRSLVEVKRMWDWIRWQRRSYRTWFEIEGRTGAFSLMRLILDGVAEAERRFLLTRTPRDPERPLRYWRPRTGSKGPGAPDADGEGPHEVYG